MTSPVTGSTTDSRAAALSMFQGDVPCLFSLGEPPCPNMARHLAWFVHEMNSVRCEENEPWPVCDDHKRGLRMISHPFWRTWHQMEPTLCGTCETPLKLERFEVL